MVKQKEHKKEVMHKESHKVEDPHMEQCCKDSSKENCCVCLSPLKAGFTLAIMMSFCMAVLAILAMGTGLGSAWVRLLGTVFFGYGASFGGMIAGLLWGFAKGFIMGYAFVWLYNNLELPKCHK